ncbi:MAG TPA: hypothetical protein VER32_11455 [Pyrinomonadaceae bacterium]|nr:hypothetical protein [Pyrinomonadaceae bacterium]
MPATTVETISEVEALVRDFESCALGRELWTHAAHLKVALWYLLHHGWDEAVGLTRLGIKRYNAASGVADTPTGGYHETLTVFWLHTVRRFLESRGDEAHAPDELARRLVASADKNLPLEFYTRARLMSPEARAAWVAPDLKPL